jgi:ABC-2 type transport system ATP-binding protein
MALFDQVEYFARLHGMDDADAAGAARHWIDRLGLSGRGRTRVDALSHGNQQRAQLAVALVHDPELLVLDEPFSGLDPGGIDDMSSILAERAAAGVTVLFSSHQLDLVEDLCESVAIIYRGRLVVSGPVADLRRGGRPRLAVRVAGDRTAAWSAGLGPAGGTVVEGTVESVRTDGTAEISLTNSADSQAILDLARSAGAVEHFAYEDRSLSEVFRAATGASVGQAEAEHAAASGTTGVTTGAGL